MFLSAVRNNNLNGHLGDLIHDASMNACTIIVYDMADRREDKGLG